MGIIQSFVGLKKEKGVNFWSRNCERKSRLRKVVSTHPEGRGRGGRDREERIKKCKASTKALLCLKDN